VLAISQETEPNSGVRHRACFCFSFFFFMCPYFAPDNTRVRVQFALVFMLTSGGPCSGCC
jgi:hypothetical protein